MKRYHYTYTEAENGLEAFEMYQASASSFQTILMDMSMPGTLSLSPPRISATPTYLPLLD
jgi:CheY-like chemotaxis protein